MLILENVTYRYIRSRPVLSGVNLTLPEGEVGVLLGKNGSGKTTLFKTILGLCKPQTGKITLQGEDLTAVKANRRAQLVAYVPQNITFGGLSVFDTVLLGRLSRFGLQPGKEDRQAAEEILAELKMEALAGENVNRLSGGERQKVAIARALLQEPHLLIFDEPTGNLDLANGQLFIREAKKIAREKNISVLTSLHDPNQALHLGDRFFFLKDGKTAYAGGQEIFTPEVLREIFGAAMRVIDYQGEKILVQGEI